MIAVDGPETCPAPAQNSHVFGFFTGLCRSLNAPAMRARQLSLDIAILRTIAAEKVFISNGLLKKSHARREQAASTDARPACDETSASLGDYALDKTNIYSVVMSFSFSIICFHDLGGSRHMPSTPPRPATPTAPPMSAPRQNREPWRPRTKPPNKAERLARFLDRIRRQDDEVRAFMAEARRRTA